MSKKEGVPKMLKVGEKAPEFTLTSDKGEHISLADFKGKQVVLYFYPKDDTPGCTIEACSFRDVYDDILAKGAVVLGLSPDNEKSHVKFIHKYNLPFYLLSDPEHEVAEAYGAWGEKKAFGKKYDGVLRSTYIIDEVGNVKIGFPNVNPKGHAQEVLDSL